MSVGIIYCQRKSTLQHICVSSTEERNFFVTKRQPPHPSLLFAWTDLDFIWAPQHAASFRFMFVSILVVVITYMGESSLFVTVSFLDISVRERWTRLDWMSLESVSERVQRTVVNSTVCRVCTHWWTCRGRRNSSSKEIGFLLIQCDDATDELRTVSCSPILGLWIIELWKKKCFSKKRWKPHQRLPKFKQ
jgi:hypothetical protein